MKNYTKLIAMTMAVSSILCACGDKKEPIETSAETTSVIESTEEPTIMLEMPDETTGPIVEEIIENTTPVESNEPEYFTNDHGTYRRVNEEVITEGNVFLRSSPNGKKVVSVNANVRLTRVGVGEENGWSIVLYKDEEVYVATYYVSPATPAKYKEVDEVVYTMQEVNFRNGPSIRCKNLGKFMKNSALTRIGIGEDGWSKIKYKDQTVYVYSQYLETRDSSEETIPVETGKTESENESILETTEPIVTEPLDEIPIEELTHFEENGVIYEVVNETVEAARTVNVRKEPSTKSEKLGQVAGAKTITRIAIGDNGWSKVIFKGEEAYIKSEYLLKR